MKWILSDALLAFMKEMYQMKETPTEAKIVRWAFTAFLSIAFMAGAAVLITAAYRYIFD